MDADGDTKIQTIKTKREKTDFLQRLVADVGDVFSAFRLRCAFQTNNGYDRLVLGSRRSLLLNFRVFLVILYIAYETIK